MLEIGCENGEQVQVGFCLVCCDREVVGWVAAPRTLDGADIRRLMTYAVESRFGAGQRAPEAVQWLSDNGSIYTALETQVHAERLGFVSITTPLRSPQSNGMSEVARILPGKRRDRDPEAAHHFLSGARTDHVPAEAPLPGVRQTARLQHLSLRTDPSYVGWIRRFLLFHQKRHHRMLRVDAVQDRHDAVPGQRHP